MNVPSSSSDHRRRTADLAQRRDRIEIRHLAGSTQETDQGQDVVRGLSQSPKTLPPRYFYDDRGSELFEQICSLPEYYLTRTETAILRRHASDIAEVTGPCELVELGSGSSTKTRLLLNAYQSQGAALHALHYVPIDVSAGMLETSAHQLIAAYPTLQVHGLAGTYSMGLAHLPPPHLPSRMIAFIGSSLGNLSPTQCDRFLQEATAAMEPGDYFLLGLDLQKPKDILEAAYDDSQGVTAAFNLNMLRHLNRRFDGNFDLSQFHHRAVYNESAHQIEIYLDSLTAQQVQLRALNFETAIASGESILTEISRKFDPDTMSHTLKSHHLTVLDIFTDDRNWFGLFLCQYQPAA